MSRHETAANGDRCPADETHGKMFLLGSGKQFCAVQTHDRARVPAVYEHDGVTPLTRKENPMAFTLPKEMKSALDTPPAADATFGSLEKRARLMRAGPYATPATASVTPASAPAKVGVPQGGDGVVCRRPTGKPGAFCDNCGRTLRSSTVRKSGIEHGK